ncbi:MAG: molybdate ABC transporter substrate-binding protein [Candidatus Poribacteria bacterium]|nr:MAG: molybdate ABC transporter substrate-binding protein [Candidatus Poribacteria bacterium]
MNRLRLRRFRAVFLLLGLLGGMNGGCLREPGTEEIVVFAAASLTDALSALGERYAERTGVRVVFNFGGTNLLADQIRRGARADLFFAADERYMDLLQREGLVLTETRTDLLGNRLVLVAQKGRFPKGLRPAELTSDGVQRIAIAQPEAVPAGVYGKEALQSLGLWRALEPKLIPALDVRAALAYVSGGEADVGIVYASDAAIAPSLEVVFVFPEDTHRPIRYPVAVLRSASRPGTAREFLKYLHSPESAARFGEMGFLFLPEAKAWRQDAP